MATTNTIEIAESVTEVLTEPRKTWWRVLLKLLRPPPPKLCAKCTNEGLCENCQTIVFG
jgi:hypothetical protein